MAPTQAALYDDLAGDLHLSWSEAELPERERTKHVHRLHPYLGKFVPQLVEALLHRYVKPGGRVLDPFAGSGTTLVQCLESGYDAVGIDIAAFNCLLMRVKTAEYDLVPARVGRARRAGAPRPLPAPADADSSREWFAPDAAAELLHFRSLLDDYEHADVLRVVLARAARSARLTTHFDLDFPRAPQRESYWCHKHRRTCTPVQEADKFLSRYLVDTLERLKAFQQRAFSRTRGGDRPRRLDRACARRLVRRDPHVAALPGPHRLPRAASLRVRDPRAGRSPRAGARCGRRSGRVAARSRRYVAGISTVLRRGAERLADGAPVLVVVNDRRNLYPEILRAKRPPPRRPARTPRQPANRATCRRVLRVDSGLCTRNVRDPGASGTRPTPGVAWPDGHEKGDYDMRKLLRRPSPAMVVACLALLVALGGTSVAAVNQLGRNTVDTPQLVNGAVTNPKIRNNAINSSKVANRSLLRSDFAPGQLPAGPVGPQGPAGPQGAAGAAGAAGPAGVIGAVTLRLQSVAIVDAAADNGVCDTGASRSRLPRERAGHLGRDVVGVTTTRTSSWSRRSSSRR